jgi:C4-dicarboxylate transporter DctQ subunit
LSTTSPAEPARPIALLLRVITHVETFGMVFFFSAALLTGVGQVVARYVFNYGLLWADQAFVKFTIWAALIGASRAVRDGLHVRVDLVLDRLAAGPRRVAELVVLAINVAFCAAMFWAALGYLEFLQMIGTTNVDTSVPEWVPFLVVPFFLALMCVRYLALIPATLASPTGDPWRPDGAPTPPRPSSH